MWKSQIQVTEFMQKYSYTINTEPTVPQAAEMIVRMKLIDEEATEAMEAMDALLLNPESLDAMVKVADGLGDLAYVVIGAAITMGLDLEPIFNEIHKSNMTKAVVKRKPGEKYGKGGGKGPSFQPPNLAPFCRLRPKPWHAL